MSNHGSERTQGKPMLTVLFSTRNGERTLPRMLDGMTAIEQPRGGWKIVAVNNGSSDSTEAILRSYTGKLPLTCVYEQRPGKNVALNRGLEMAEGDLVVFTDDDVIPQRDWLCVWREIADTAHAYSIFGGSIRPFWEVEPEEAILTALPLDTLYAVTEAAWPEGEAPVYRIWGANMAVRMEVFAAGHRFEESIGPNGTTTYAMGSEVEFVKRIAGDGYRCYYCPRAAVQHIIRSHQVTPRWIRWRAFRYGRFTSRVMAGQDVACVRLFGYPRYLIRAVLEQIIRTVRAMLLGTRSESLKQQWRLFCLAGEMQEKRHMGSRNKSM